MQENFVKTFREFQSSLQIKSIQMTHTKFNSIISNFSYFLVDQENNFEPNIDQLKRQAQIIVIDKYTISDGNSTKNYFIISMTNTVIIVEQMDLPLIKYIFTINNKTTVFFLSNTKIFFENLMNCEYNENDEEMALFQTEINNFKNKFNATKKNSQCILTIWNIIKTSIAGYLIKKSYSKSIDRINFFFEKNDKENKFYDKESTEEEYVHLRNIGQGSSGVVSLVYHIEKGKLFAIKNFYDISNEKENHNREIDNYKSMSHPLIAQFHGIIYNNQSKNIVIEYIDGITLQKCLYLNRIEKMKIIFEILIIFEYLHNKHFVYRDLKPNNIMIDKNKTAILIDFDRMINYDDMLNNPKTKTLDFFTIYCAPEISQGKVAYASDIYSIGMIIYFILTIELQNNKKSKFKPDIVEFSNIPYEFSEFKSIIKKCVNKKQEERPTISKLIEEFYINFYSIIDSEGKYSHFIDNEIITSIKGIHNQRFLKYWISLAEYQYPITKSYRNSVNFYVEIVPEPIIELFTNRASPKTVKNNVLFFEILPSDYQAMKDCIQDQYIQKMCSKFTFFYYNYLKIIQNKRDQNEFKDSLFGYLKDLKFITCQFTNLNLKSKIVDAVICSEGKCFIIENIYLNNIDEVISKIKESGSSVINISSISKEETNEKLAKQEIKNFCLKFHHEIENNKFVSLTISSIACYLIHRYFYPTEYFNDQSFFIFRKHSENEQKTELNSFIKSKNVEEVLFKLESMYDLIISDTNQHNIIQEFKEDEFIKLRTIKVDNQATYSLVFHLESQYIFLMKKINNIKIMTEEINHEIDMCQQYKNRVFVPFYGFVKEDSKIIGFIYEYMSNSSFDSFISSHKDIINSIYSLIILARILEGIEYLSKNSHNYKISNILVDHDYNVYISDFSYDETSKKQFESINDKSNEYPSDINLYCQIANYLLDNQSNENIHQIDYNDLPKLEIIKNIKNLYNYYSNNNQKTFSIYDYIKSMIIKEMKSFENFEKTSLNTKDNLRISDIVQFFFESIKMIRHENSTEIGLFLKEISIVIFLYLTKNENDKSLLFEFLSHLYNSNNKIIKKNLVKVKKYYEISANLNNPYDLVNLGNLYINGKCVDKDYCKARECYELSAQQNNSYAIFNLASLYMSGYGVKQNYIKAIELYEKSSKLGNSQAFILLGYMHANGKGVEQNYLKAKEYYELSAQMNNSRALVYLGNLYENGHGVKKDYSKAKEYYEKSESLNNSSGQYQVGRLYLFGLGVKKDYSIAKEHFELSAKKDNPNALYYLGHFYENGLCVEKNYLKAKEYYKLSAKQDNSDSLFHLGNMYLNGLGVEKNYLKAIKYLELSGQLNNSLSLYYLGIIYENGLGVNQNYMKAKEYYEIAAYFNNSDALLNLGSLYYNGLGVEKNHLKAKEYFELSAKLNNSKAFLGLGLIYTIGRGVKHDYLIAKKYFELSSANNESAAFFCLAALYMHGLGVKKDYLISKKYLEISAQQNYQNALFYLGYFYHMGIGVEQDFSKAKMYYELAAQKNNSNAILYIGLLYENGQSVKQDLFKAKKFYELSAQYNNKAAFYHLGLLYQFGRGVKKDISTAFKYIELSAQLNDSNALNCLASFYLHGIYVKKDYLKAKKYYELSAKQNNSFALCNLGLFYCKEFYFAKDYLKGKQYFEQSFNLNNPDAAYHLGKLYEKGEGVKQDYLKAVEYFEKAGNLGHSDALVSLGFLYYNGFGVMQNYMKARKYFELAVKFNNSAALINLGEFYLNGYGVEKNYSKAKEYFKLSASLGNSIAMFLLGYYYSNGNVFDIDIEKSIYFYKKCLEQHYSTINNEFEIINYNEFYYQASNNLGLIYITVYNDKQSLELGFNYIKEAGLNEYPFGQNNLGLLYQFYIKNLGNAKYMYKRSLKNCFALAAYNLGFMNEKEKNAEKSIKYYIKASEYENKPLKFHGKHYDDQRLNISITFIICFTNLKLVEYFYSKKEMQKCREYFIKSFSKINHNSKFKLTFTRKNCRFSFSYLMAFIFNYQPFNLINQPNIDQKTKEKIQDLIKIHFFENEINDSKFDRKSIKAENQNENEISKKMIQKGFDSKVNDLSTFKSENKMLSSMEKAKLKDDIKKIFVFNDVGDLFDFVIKDDKLVKEFIDDIKSIIEIMHTIIYSPPYLILYGRISIENPKTQDNTSKFKKDINETFYEGFGI